jgi:PKD repeat protein
MTADANGSPLVEDGRRFVAVTWDDAGHWARAREGGGDAHHTFQIVLFEDGEIQMAYARMVDASSTSCSYYAHEQATVGINLGDGIHATELFSRDQNGSERGTYPAGGTAYAYSFDGANYQVSQVQPVAYRFRTNGSAPLLAKYGTWLSDAAYALSSGVGGGVRVTLPFAFPFYENQRNSVWISSHGYLSFSPTDPQGSAPTNPRYGNFWSAAPSRFPVAAGDGTTSIDCRGNVSYVPDEMFAPLWSALVGTDRPYAIGNNHGSIYYLDKDADGNQLQEGGRQYVVITWADMNHWARALNEGADWHFTFQVTLFEDGEIRVAYDRLEPPDTVGSCSYYAQPFVTIGVNRGDNVRGIELFSYSQSGMIGSPPAAGTAYSFTYDGTDYGFQQVAFEFRERPGTSVPPLKPGEERLYYTWDFGDGSPLETAIVGDPTKIATRHTYQGIGQTYVATLTVEDASGAISSQSARIRVGDPQDLAARVNVVIQQQLLWLYGQRKPEGSFRGSSGRPEADTGMALLSFCNQGFLPSGDASRHPYVEAAQKARDFLLTRFVPLQGFGPKTIDDPADPSHTTQITVDPDTNGNGLGFYVGNFAYVNGITVMGLIGTLEPDLPVAMNDLSGNPIQGYTLRDLIQDCIDGIAWAQGDWNGTYEGGWHYSPWDQSADGSTNQWPVIAIYEAERNGFNCTIPAFVKARMPSWILYDQTVSGSDDDGGFGYGGPGWWVTVGKTGGGLVAHKVLGLGPGDAQVDAALAFIGRNWTDPGWWNSGSSVTDSLYDVYSVAKGLRVHGITDVVLADGSVHNWYQDLAREIVDVKAGDLNSFSGAMTSAWSDSATIATAYSVLTLTQSVVGLPPVADACGGLCTGAGNDKRLAVPSFQVLTLDASRSHHLDTRKSIVLYEWDIDGDGVYSATQTIDAATAQAQVFTGDVKTTSPWIHVLYGGQPRDVRVKLRVTDDSDSFGEPLMTDEDALTVSLTFQNVPPQVVIARMTPNPVHIYSQAATFEAGAYNPDPLLAGTYDPNYELARKNFIDAGGDPDHLDPAILAEDVKSLEWDLDGDGAYEYAYTVSTSENGTRTYTPANGATPPYPPTRTYTVAGTYTIRLRAKDAHDDPQTTSDDVVATAVLQVVNDAPTAGEIVVPAEVEGGPNGATITALARGFRDPEGRTLTFNWSWTGGSKTSADGEGIGPGDPAGANSRTTLGALSTGTDQLVPLGPAPTYLRTIRVRALDGSGGASAEVAATVRVVDDAPLASIGGATTVQVSATAQFHDESIEVQAGSTLDDTIVSRTWDFGDPASGAANTSTEADPTHVFAAVGLYTVRLTVVDSDGSRSVATLDVTVTDAPPPPNRAPTASDKSYTTGENVPTSVKLVASDPDGDPLTFTITQPPAHGTLSTTGSVRSYVPAPNFYGTDSFKFTASDPGGLTSNEATVTIEVLFVNQPPVAANGSATTLKNTPVQVNLAALVTDVDSTTFTYQVVGASNGTAVVNAAGRLTFTPAPGYVGPASVTYRATDDAGAQSNTGSISIDVINNRPPVLAPVPERRVGEGFNLTFSLEATDPDGDAVSFGAARLPSGATFDAASGVFSWTPAFGAVGTYDVMFSATDGIATVEEPGRIVVFHTNRPPAFVTVGSEPVASEPGRPWHMTFRTVEGVAVRFTVTATDPDGDPLVYAAANMPRGAVWDSAGRTFSWTPRNGQAGSYEMLFVTSDGSLTDAGTVTVEVDALRETGSGSGCAAVPGRVAGAGGLEMVLALAVGIALSRRRRSRALRA